MKTVPCVWVVERKDNDWVALFLLHTRKRAIEELRDFKQLYSQYNFRIRKYIRSGE